MLIRPWRATRSFAVASNQSRGSCFVSGVHYCCTTRCRRRFVFDGCSSNVRWSFLSYLLNYLTVTVIDDPRRNGSPIINPRLHGARFKFQNLGQCFQLHKVTTHNVRIRARIRMRGGVRDVHNNVHMIRKLRAVPVQVQVAGVTRDRLQPVEITPSQ